MSMRCFRTAISAKLLLSTAAYGLFGGAPAVGQLQPGSKIPPVTVKTLSGQMVNLQAACRQNQAVVLSFYAKFLPLSAAQLPALERLNTRYSGPGRVQMLGFARDIDTKDDLDDYLKRLNPRPTFEMCGSAATKEATAKLAVQALPTVYVVNSASVVSYSETGFGVKTPADIESAIKRILEGK